MAFKLSAQLVGHDSDVRDVSFPSPTTVLSVSRDCTVRKWIRPSSSPTSFEGFVIGQGSDYINSVAFIPPSTPQYPHGLVVSGGKDTIIDVRSPDALPDHNAERMLIGHGHNICALDVSPDGSWLVSGGWDCQARVWTVGKWDTDFLLQDHQLSVWAVLAFDDKTVITGCADKQIRIFHLAKAVAGDVRPSSTIHTPDIVRALCKIPSTHPSNADFACACNDGVIRLYKLNGQLIDELRGHDSYVYSLAALPSTGELVSSGEDRTVRIWQGNRCVQTITHPALSVWSVAACAETGDIVTGASDNVARVFSRSPDRVADAETLRMFEEAIQVSSIPQQQLGAINKEKVPGAEFLTTKAGTKDGQVQVVKHDDGSLAAYTWSMALQKWEHVGAVVDSASSSGRKQSFNGQQYDYVFDVDIDESKPHLKLPYNLSQNVFEAARKFLEDNELPISYLDSVVKFLEENTKGATLGMDSGSGSADSRADSGSEAAGGGGGGAAKTLPQTEYVALLNGKFDNMINKIHSINKNLISSGRKDYALNPAEEQALSDLRPCIEGAIPIQGPDLAIVIKIVSHWDYADILAGMDMLRFLVRHPAAVEFTSASTDSILDVVISSALRAPEGQQVQVNCVIMAIRAIANLFLSAEGAELMGLEVEKTVSFLERAAPVGANNRHVQIATATALINLAVASRQGKEMSRDVKQRMKKLLGSILENNTDSEVLYRAIVALGTLEVDADAEGKQWVEKVLAKSEEARVKKLCREFLA
ncbi:hypothetical protein TD95_002567 [Thielaviopsis punctulata]|uniref:PFU domain-containing protein n=1 Tax=Thielaviopsis punctulata TaxID=72032 RepID=A0A0F4ZKJ6_9PEZI|nr:hypothetical protein TD95_002567 [Thielaviopsis punctulata]